MELLVQRFAIYNFNGNASNEWKWEIEKLHEFELRKRVGSTLRETNWFGNCFGFNGPTEVCFVKFIQNAGAWKAI